MLEEGLPRGECRFHFSLCAVDMSNAEIAVMFHVIPKYPPVLFSFLFYLNTRGLDRDFMFISFRQDANK